MRMPNMTAGWIIVIAVIAGCDSSTRSSYPADFQVTSAYPVPIIVSDWAGMGWVCPSMGVMPPDSDESGGTSFHRQDKSPPEKIVVVWHVQVNPNVAWRDDIPKEIFRQEIQLLDVIPKGGKGTTVFHIDKNGHWTVKFKRAE